MKSVHLFALFKSRKYWKCGDPWNISLVAAKLLPMPMYFYIKMEEVLRRGGITKNIMAEYEAEGV